MLTELNQTEAAQWRGTLENAEGYCFLDSSLRDDGQGRFSIHAAGPLRVIRGDISDVSPLENALAEFGRVGGPEVPFPLGALIGTVDYEGTYHFGVYPWLLITDHRLEKSWLTATPPVLPLRRMAFDTPGLHPEAGVESNFTRETFMDVVERAREYIAAGDIYQVNLSQQFRLPGGAGDLRPLYGALREISPAPFAAFLDQGPRQVMSSSPELFLKISGRHCLTRPIKGTRPRFADEIRDDQSAFELIRSEKDLAELVMITDLERNDLGQFCEYGSVRVTDLVRLEKFAQVFHLVSTVEGRMRQGVSHPGALQRMFPGGSITGAPKKRAREIIRELERQPRGLYTGSIGYFGFNGESSFNIAIRTLVAEAGEIRYGVGSGITAGSDPGREYEETLHKAAGMRLALEQCRRREIPQE
ncbi:MAG: anthranilate synthase component I family protein [Verrucomicrobiae bacterium]|nr:anthranilate synthase component I family protein [Verrucomicrobiae bacterium]